MLLWPKSVTVLLSVHHPPRTPSDWPGRWDLCMFLLSHKHSIHTSIYEHIRQIVAGSGGNTIDLALLCTRINEKYIEFSVPLKISTDELSDPFNSSKILPRTPHKPKILPPTKELLYNIQERLILAGQPYPLPPIASTCDAQYSNEHYHSTYGTRYPLTTTKKEFAQTPVPRAPTGVITLSPLNTINTLSLGKLFVLAHATRFL